MGSGTLLSYETRTSIASTKSSLASWRINQYQEKNEKQNEKHNSKETTILHIGLSSHDKIKIIFAILNRVLSLFSLSALFSSYCILVRGSSILNWNVESWKLNEKTVNVLKKVSVIHRGEVQ